VELHPGGSEVVLTSGESEKTVSGTEKEKGPQTCTASLKGLPRPATGSTTRDDPATEIVRSVPRKARNSLCARKDKNLHGLHKE
jgi:hypothetical protein